jgi:hypothetical protein
VGLAQAFFGGGGGETVFGACDKSAGIFFSGLRAAADARGSGVEVEVGVQVRLPDWADGAERRRGRPEVFR